MRTTDIDSRSIAQNAMQQLKSCRVDAAEISIMQSNGFSVTARSGAVDTLEHHLAKSFSVTVYHQQCTGSASSSDFSATAIVQTIEKAIRIARFSNPDPCAGLADPNRLAVNYLDCQLYFPWEISPETAINQAIQAEKIACAEDNRLQSDGVSVSTSQSQYLYANTLGFLGEYHSSEHGVSCSMIARENNHMQRDDAYTVARNPAELESMTTVAKRAAEKTLQRLGSRRIKTTDCPVIFKASIAKTLVGAFISAVSGGNLYRQTSFLLNALGEKIFPDTIHIAQQPHLLSAMGSRPFDAEGVATIDQSYVRDGKLIQYVLGSYSARKLGLSSTGNAGGVFNCAIHSHDEVTFAQLMQQMGSGLLITELLGQGVNITTGDYSRGIAGFWIEKGEIQFPVEEVTIAGNLKNMFAGILGIATDVDRRGSIRTGSILINKMTMAGL